MDSGFVVLSQDSTVSGAVIGPTICQLNDPRRLRVTIADYIVMLPFYDARGAPRWQFSGGVINYVPPASRTAVDPDRVRALIEAYLDAQARVTTATGLGWNSSHPALFARIQAWANEKQQAVADALRAGQASDDPVTPSKTIITPQ